MMTPWVSHDANYPFGRGAHYLDNSSNPTTAPILPGTQMKSGFKATLLTDTEADLGFAEMII